MSETGRPGVTVCGVLDHEGGKPCGQPAQVYPMPLGVTHTACPRHRLMFLALLGEIHTAMYGEPAAGAGRADETGGR